MDFASIFPKITIISRGLTLGKKFPMAEVSLFLPGAIAFLVYLTTGPIIAPLYSGLSQSDMGEIAQAP